ncbi:hypothetical protein RJ639_039715 [Escallonia herrerae]|uniref:DUF241 domain protein n=1 Tax=Escallonia herrerae TaxID=1293975 RepID=A0AA89B5Z0_9ASTE|nr:hypothetical protein RJ639_039715 [Escallonia herrerae]
MAVSYASLGFQCHGRSISLPSRLQPNCSKIETELNRLKTWEVSSVSATAPLNMESIQNGLVGLAELYNSLEELVHSPATQQALLHYHHDIPVEDALEVSITLLDSCGAIRDFISMMKEQVHDLQSALRRKGGDSSIDNNISAYFSFRKKVKKEICKNIRSLKQMENNVGASLLSDANHHLALVTRLQREVTSITISVFRSLLLFVSVPSSITNPNGWSLISKLMLTRSVASGKDHGIVNEVGSVDLALKSLHDHIKHNDARVGVEMASQRLKALDSSIERLEARLDGLFRQLIKSRVSLLNIFAQ